MLLSACPGDIVRGDVSENAKLHSFAAEAMKPIRAARGADHKGYRATDAVYEATVSYNLKCVNENGMAISENEAAVAGKLCPILRAARGRFVPASHGVRGS